MPRRLLTALALAVGLAPPGASALEVVGSSARFSWQPATGPVLGYVVYVSRNGSDLPALGNQFASGTTADVAGAVGDEVVISVAAVGPGGAIGPLSERSYPVRFVTTPSPPKVALSTELLVVSAITGVTPPPATVSVVNAGGGSLSFTATPLTSLVRATPGSGTSQLASVPITLEFDSLGLGEGMYYSGLQVSAPGIAGRLLGILVNVFPPVPEFHLSSQRLAVPALLGQAAGETALTLSSSVPDSGYLVTTDADWISVGPRSGVSSDTPDTLYVNLDSAALPRGAYSGHIYVTPTDPRAPALTADVTLTVLDPAAKPRRDGPDLNGDGRADLLFRDRNSGALQIWLMNGGQRIGSALLPGPTPAADWVLAAATDLDGDGRTDLVWQHPASGLALVWFMSGVNPVRVAAVPTPGPGWRIVAAGDVDGDGRGDLVHQQMATGDLRVWLMRGAAHTGTITPDRAGESVDTVLGCGDFDATGTADVLWRSTSGATLLWLSRDGTPGTLSPLALPGEAGWTVGAMGDQDGDGKTDLVLRNDRLRETKLWRFQSPTVIDVFSLPAMRLPGWTLETGADFDGDGRSDLLWRNTGTGEGIVWLMQGVVLKQGASLASPPPVTWEVQP